MVTRRTLVKGLATAPVLGSIVMSAPRVMAQDAIGVGSKNFPEALIIGEMYALALENAGLTVERSLNLGGTGVAHEALLAGDIDLYPEYTGTGLIAVLEATLADVTGSQASPVAGAAASPVAGDTVDAVYNYVNQQYQEQFGLVWLDQSPMNNSQALAVTRDFADEHGLSTISQLAELAGDEEIVISAPSDFEERPDGLIGLRDVYGGGFEDVEVNGVDPGIKYQALTDGDANVVLAFSTDAEIAFFDLVVLEDDLGLWPPYHVAPVVRQDTLDANPLIGETLNTLSPLLTTEVMIELNGLVVGEEKQDPADVARQFLVDQQLISE
ncbi:MAG: glycine betaine ABC transporter substrate-binding protein [Thermomicrobiales bacterium]